MLGDNAEAVTQCALRRERRKPQPAAGRRSFVAVARERIELAAGAKKHAMHARVDESCTRERIEDSATAMALFGPEPRSLGDRVPEVRRFGRLGHWSTVRGKLVVRECDLPAGPKDARDLGEKRIEIGNVFTQAQRNDDVERIAAKTEIQCVALHEADVREPRRACE
jgi:hypothetical protein